MTLERSQRNTAASDPLQQCHILHINQEGTEKRRGIEGMEKRRGIEEMEKRIEKRRRIGEKRTLTCTAARDPL